jgi:hypothetical protein
MYIVIRNEDDVVVAARNFVSERYDALAFNATGSNALVGLLPYFVSQT